jgi:hypothetical protein
MYHALLHACHVFNVLPLKDLVTSDGVITTPYQLFVGSKPKVSHFRVFGFPCIVRSGQSPWMANLRTTARAHKEVSEEFT